jgi:MFS family permease
MAKPVDAKPSEILKTGRFWLMWTMYVIGSGAGLMVISDVLGLAKKSLAERAFIAVALFAVGNAAGRIVAGMLSDKIGRRLTLRIMLAFQALLMFLAIPLVVKGGAGQVLLVVFATFIGFNYGTNLSLFPSLAKDNWGLKNFGMNYGLLFTAWGVGGLIFSEMYQRMKSAGQQSTAFIVMGVVLLLAAAMTFLLPGWRKPSETPSAEETPEPDLVGLPRS